MKNNGIEVKMYDGTSKDSSCSLEKYRDKEIEELWEQFEDVLFIEAKDFYKNDEYKDDITLVLASDWQGWSAGTSRETIWRWFDENHSKGIHWLLYGTE